MIRITKISKARLKELEFYVSSWFAYYENYGGKSTDNPEVNKNSTKYLQHSFAYDKMLILLGWKPKRCKDCRNYRAFRKFAGKFDCAYHWFNEKEGHPNKKENCGRCYFYERKYWKFWRKGTIARVV